MESDEVEEYDLEKVQGQQRRCFDFFFVVVGFFSCLLEDVLFPMMASLFRGHLK